MLRALPNQRARSNSDCSKCQWWWWWWWCFFGDLGGVFGLGFLDVFGVFVVFGVFGFFGAFGVFLVFGFFDFAATPLTAASPSAVANRICFKAFLRDGRFCRASSLAAFWLVTDSKTFAARINLDNITNPPYGSHIAKKIPGSKNLR
jgi:hypothetical protein